MARHPLASRAYRGGLPAAPALYLRQLQHCVALSIRAAVGSTDAKRQAAGAQHTSTQTPCTCSYWRREGAGECAVALWGPSPPPPPVVFACEFCRFSVDMLHLGRQQGAPLTPLPACPNNTQLLQGRATQLGAPAAAVRSTDSTQPGSPGRAGR